MTAGENTLPDLSREEILSLMNEMTALAATEHLYKEMIETVNSIVIQWNRDFSIEYINSFGARFFGYQRRELIGADLFKTIVADTESTGRDMRGMLDGLIDNPDRMQNSENENVTRDCRRVWISWSNRAILSKDGKTIAMLSVGNDITALKQTQDELKSALAENGRILHKTEELNRKLEELARTDELTGLLNRRVAMERLDSEFKRSRRYGYPLGVLFLDIDNFKQINDTWGHDTGDRTLRIIAEVVSSCTRHEDTAARIGGEEFCLIMPYASSDWCLNAGERLRLAVANVSLERFRAGEIPRQVTVSIGGSSSDRAINSGEDLLKVADNMMYQSKHSGRNRVTISGVERAAKTAGAA
ncbi:MAG: sensor domain-containing diguanylate cyclase [Myxococcota bacterium]|jgi:diguanylate cyclase (GGDEF)-like protein/PAS domain S-box-containing protein